MNDDLILLFAYYRKQLLNQYDIIKNTFLRYTRFNKYFRLYRHQLLNIYKILYMVVQCPEYKFQDTKQSLNING